MILKLLSLLLRYPDAEVLAARGEIAGAVRKLPPSPAKEAVLPFLSYWENEDPHRLQEDYVATFDFKAKNSLYLTYYQYGDQRMRGPALAELKALYARSGYPMDTSELPDYLPLVLEFASVAPEEGTAVLAGYRKGLEVARKALRQAGSPYAALFEALRALLPQMDEEEAREVRELILHGPPRESVGLEPYGPEMPPPNDTALYGRKS